LHLGKEKFRAKGKKTYFGFVDMEKEKSDKIGNA